MQVGLEASLGNATDSRVVAVASSGQALQALALLVPVSSCWGSGLGRVVAYHWQTGPIMTFKDVQIKWPKRSRSRHRLAASRRTRQGPRATSVFGFASHDNEA